MKYYIIACFLVLNACQNTPKTELAETCRSPVFYPGTIPRSPRMAFNKSHKGAYALQGIWVRKDLIEIIRTTRSLFEAKKIVESKPGSGILALGIKPENKDSLIVCMSAFGTQMPLTCYINIRQAKQALGYQTLCPDYDGKTINESQTYFSLLGKSLIMQAQTGQKTEELVFQKLVFQGGFVCSGHADGANTYVLTGEYQLKDKNNKIVQNKVSFDGKGKTDFPGFKKYWVGMGYWHSIHHAMQTRNKPDLKKDAEKSRQTGEMLKNGAIDQEDFLTLSNRVSNELQQSFILHKTKNGFDVYSLKKERLTKWELAYKKELVYRLVRKD